MTKAATTPIRNNNNYANPNTTPITSVKRPRSSLNGSAMKKTPSGKGMSTAAETPARGENAADQSMSPMHPVRPVEREDTEEEEEATTWLGRTNALFSPVLSFLSSGSNDGGEEEASAVTDEDVTMEDTPQKEELEPVEEKVPIEEEEATLEEDPSSEAEEEDDDQDDFNPYLFIRNLPPYRHVQHLRPPVALPPKDPNDPPITLVLDLDETLVHCTVESASDAHLTFPVVFHGMEYLVNVKLRPHVFDFLNKVHDKFEVVVFTASQRVYADELLNRIDPTGKFIKHRMFRDSCLAVEGNFLKDLTVVGRDMSKMVLVDNSPHAFGYQIDNGVPIESWFDDMEDTELIKLERFLSTLHSCKDVRTAVRSEFETWRKVGRQQQES